MRATILKMAVTGTFLAMGMMGSVQAASAATPQASATTAPAAVSTAGGTIKVSTEMHYTGFDAAVAKAHGYEIRTNAAGLQYSVKIGSNVSPGSDPVKLGKCGASYVYYSAFGARSQSPKYGASFDTGYTVALPAVEGNWTLDVADSHGVGALFYGSAANGTGGWSASGDTWHSVTGYSYAEVNTSSWVLLENGGFCTSAGPWDSTNLY
jgi:hypothetical protein